VVSRVRVSDYVCIVHPQLVASGNVVTLWCIHHNLLQLWLAGCKLVITVDNTMLAWHHIVKNCMYHFCVKSVFKIFRQMADIKTSNKSPLNCLCCSVNNSNCVMFCWCIVLLHDSC